MLNIFLYLVTVPKSTSFVFLDSVYSGSSLIRPVYVWALVVMKFHRFCQLIKKLVFLFIYFIFSFWSFVSALRFSISSFLSRFQMIRENSTIAKNLIFSNTSFILTSSVSISSITSSNISFISRKSMFN